jgi:hypothetical protein
MNNANGASQMTQTSTSWEDMSELQQAAAIYWDMYKDAHGVRPRGINTDSWTKEQFDREIEQLEDVITADEVLRKEAESAAITKFEARVQDLIQTGAEDRAAALRWIHEAEDAEGDTSYLCFILGLPYGYLNG